MVEHFEMRFGHITSLYLINLVINMVAAPLVGRAVGRYGARNAHLLEYLGLLVVFCCLRRNIFGLGPVFGRRALCSRPHVLLSWPCNNDKFLENCRPGRYSSNGGCYLYNQSHCSYTFFRRLV